MITELVLGQHFREWLVGYFKQETKNVVSYSQVQERHMEYWEAVAGGNLGKDGTDYFPPDSRPDSK